MLAGETAIELPVTTNVPPQLPEYQTQVSEFPSVPVSTDKVVEAPTQIAGEDAIAEGSVDNVAMVGVTLAQLV